MEPRGFLEEALQRGEKFKSQLIEDIFESRLVGRLLGNKKFLDGVAGLLNAKSKLEENVGKNLHQIFKFLEIPTREEIASMEKKIRLLENTLDNVQRKALSRSLRKKAAKVVTKHHRK